jgi:hypothetical protein
MLCLPALVLLPALYAPAKIDADPEPVPMPLAAIERVNKALSGKPADVEKLKKTLVEQLKKRAAELEKAGKKEKAHPYNDAAIIIESMEKDRGLAKITAAELLKVASVKGKYKKLLHVLWVPADEASYKDPCDYGPYSGTSWAGYTGLKPGKWVYTNKRWFIWAE